MTTSITSLPLEIVSIIKSYIPPTSLVWLNKNNYNNYNHLIRRMIPDHRFEDYIRDTVRYDNVFILRHIIKENINRWLKMRRWRYKNIIYYDYLHFIYNYAIEQQSYKARDLINMVATEVLGIKWHKKNGIKYIRTKWTS
uniref:Uncharacterized protein n=1 Tax=viral metagenome TaxID=1070528 RepID=A0A6C0CPT0_9ZZZZ